MKLHISIEEFDKLKSRQTLEFQCYYCNAIYLLSKHKIQDFLKRGDELSGHFCSPKCRGRYEVNINHIKTNCNHCNKEIIKSPKEFKRSDNHFCNQSCSAKYFNKFRLVELIHLECAECNKGFDRPKYNLKNKNINNFCSRSCSALFKTKMANRNTTEKTTKIKIETNNEKENKSVYIPIHKRNITVKCLNCNKDTLKSPYQINKNKYNFCSRSCHAIYGNKTFNKTSRFGINKSKAESEMVAIIKKDFPNLNIIENDRKILNGLELDIYIPDKNVGIELNGPCHYIPIFGENELSKTKNKDIIKKETMQKLKIHFFQINIMGAGKKLPEILLNAYNEQIKPLLL